MANSTTSDEVRHGATAIILTHDGKILLQARNDYFIDGRPVIGRFGGGLEPEDVNAAAGLARELHEELGAIVNTNDLVFLDEVVAPNVSGVRGQTVTYFWHDKEGSIVGCYEGTPVYFNTIDEALACPQLSQNTRNVLLLVLENGLLSSLLSN